MRWVSTSMIGPAGALLGLFVGSLAGWIVTPSDATLQLQKPTPQSDGGKSPPDADRRFASLGSLGVSAAGLDRAPAPPDPFGQSFARGKVITGATRHRLILFSFDDGPNVGTTPELLDLLDAEGIRAVFFLTAERIRGDTPRERAHQRIAREILRRGHTVANHTARHVSLFSLDPEEIDAELLTVERIMERVLGGRPYLFRPPGGNRSPRTDDAVEARGYTQVLWNLGAGDTQTDSPAAVFETWVRVLDRREREQGERGGIVLLHDLQAHSVEALRLILRELRRRNCRLLQDPTEELYDIVDDLAFFYQARKPNITGQMAPAAVIPPALLAARQAALREDAALSCAEAAPALATSAQAAFLGH